MTEKELQILGFEKEYEFGSDNSDWYYYSYKIADGMSLISCTNDQMQDNQWYVEVFNTEPAIRFCQMEKVQSLINTLETALIKI